MSPDMLRSLCAPAALLMLMCCSSQRDSTPATALAASTGPAGSSGADGHTSAAHGNHDPHHGGVVYMKDNLHFEVVMSRSGQHRIYFSDATRADLPAATASEVTLTFSNGEGAAETLRAEVDENGESWVAAGKPLKRSEGTARVAFVVDGEPYWIDVPLIETAGAQVAP